MFDVNEDLTTSQNPEEDIFEVFKRAVANGQTRLALEALVPVLEVIIDIITPDENESETVTETIQVQPTLEKKIETTALEVETPAEKKKEKQTVKEPVQQKEQLVKD